MLSQTRESSCQQFGLKDKTDYKGRQEAKKYQQN